MNALTQQEVWASNRVVEGTICLSKIVARVLFDSGATHSFISSSFATKINKKSEPLSFQLVVSTSVGTKLTTDVYYKGCEITIGEMKTHADLIKLREMEYNIILGMNWLSTYHAHVDYHQKKIIFKMARAPEYVYEGTKNKVSIPVLSALKATKLLRHGCREFLATLIDKKNKQVRIEVIAVVMEYPDVFPEDLPGLPPDRDVELSIDLLTETRPITKAPYKLAPAEMKELKEQLQELLDLGLIRSSASP